MSGRWARLAAGLLAGLVWAASGAAAEGPNQARSSAKAAQTLLLDATRAGDRIVAVGAWGHVILSDDGGASWRQARRVPTRAVLTSVHFVDDRLGWAAGHDAVVIHTGDGGETWSLQHRDVESDTPLFSVWMADARRGYAVGAFGLALATRDGGRHWAPVPILPGEDDLHLNALFEGPGGTLFIAAEAGRVLRSTDGGTTWTALDPPYTGSFWGGLATPDAGVLVFGMRGHLLRSDDGGESWQSLDSGTDQSLSGGTVLRDGRSVLVGLGGTVSQSRDAGRRFRAWTRTNRRGANAVLEGAAGLLVFGEGGVEALDPAADPAP
ncbi:MAG: WD40/YVTN/BNR-like repeat-containing protein [Myxococcota bacterium]